MNYDETVPYEDVDINELIGEPIEQPVYEVWALGYDNGNVVADAEALLGVFSDPDEAVAYAKNVTLADVIHHEAATPLMVNDDLFFAISVEVETVVNMPDDETGTMNVGTVFRKTIYIDDYTDEDVM